MAGLLGMKVELVSRGIPDLVPQPDRSPGTHVSDIIHKLAIGLGHYDDRRDLNMTRLQLGCALEWAIIQRYAADEPGRYIQPGELERDGLYGTPDLIDVTTDEVHEIKLTWGSSENPPCAAKPGTDEYEPTPGAGWRYFRQLQAYCFMWGVLVGRLHIGYINGNYRDDREPDYKVWRCTFSDHELETNWQLLLNNR